MRVGPFLVGLAFILAGVIMFFHNFDLVQWDILIQLRKMWPLIFIIVGLSLFWRGIIPRWVAVLIALLLAGGFAALLFSYQGPLKSQMYLEQLAVNRSDYPGAASGNIDVRFGGGSLSLGSSTDQWAEAVFRGPGVATGVERNNDEIKIRMSQAENIRWSQNNQERMWDIDISPDLAWLVSIQAGAFKGDLDLGDIPLRSLELKMGAADVDMVLGNNGINPKISINAGASNIKIKMQGDTGMRVRFNGALSSTNLDQLGWRAVDNYYISPNYEEAGSRIDLYVDMGLGSFRLDPNYFNGQFASDKLEPAC